MLSGSLFAEDELENKSLLADGLTVGQNNRTVFRKQQAPQIRSFPTSSSQIDISKSTISINNNTVQNGIDHSNISHLSHAESSTSKKSFIETGIYNNTLFPANLGSIQDSFSQVRFNYSTVNEVGSAEIGSTEIDFSKYYPAQSSSTEFGFTEVGFVQPSSTEVGSTEVGSTQINISQVSIIQENASEPGLGEISFSSSISPEQFFSSHNSTSEIINELNNSATNIWSDLLQSEIQLNINFQITDLPKGQLAEASITGFDSSGKPNAGTILIDHDANGVGWFIDETPLDNSEFTAQNSASYFLAATESEANGKYDLLTTVLHELAHLYGFIDGYAGFEQLKTENTLVGDNFTATLDGEHLDKQAHPRDLLNTHLAPGIRKLPSELDVEILKAIVGDKSKVKSPKGYRSAYQKSKVSLEAALTSDPLLGIINGDFSIADNTNNNLGWQNRGDSIIDNGQAVLTEDSPFLSNFTQTFTVPEDANNLQFTLVEIGLGSENASSAPPASSASPAFPTPPDSFEVALLDPLTLTPLVNTDIGLTETDALLNIQNDGTTYFSNNVRISGVNTGEIIDYTQSRTISIDISHLAAGTEATLYFDLLGFGAIDSRIVIDDVKLTEQIFLAPITTDDTATTDQGRSVIIDILNNDRDDDGAIATNSVQIQTQPNNGSVIKLPDCTVSYVPDIGFAGTGFAGTVGANGHSPLQGIHKFADNRNHSATIIV